MNDEDLNSFTKSEDEVSFEAFPKKEAEDSSNLNDPDNLYVKFDSFPEKDMEDFLR